MWPTLRIGQRRPEGKARENALGSFELALREGAEGIALDVQLSSDGVPVVIGDVRQNRRFPSRARRQQERILLLSEILQWVRDQKCMAFVAIKHPPPGIEAKVLMEVDRAKVRHLTRVIAFNLRELRRLRQLDAKVHLGLRFAGRPPAIRHAKALGAEVLLPHWSAASPSFIRRAHRASMLVIPWTVDSPRQMRRTILGGVDGIITNFPAKLAEAVARLQKAVPGVPS
ncbi:MAG TPA: glycerophosphodiester phosphodiesterase [Terriglobia bacterium]|nr:glycerophosphodiester phosphodiesterase [Terriglobia bacterium]